MTIARGLAGHAVYSCRHSGACCSSGWPIPVERDLLPRLAEALERRTVRPAGCGVPLVSDEGLGGDFGALLGRDGPRCVFHDADGVGCRLHAALGPSGKPGACQQFPWVAVRDPRGTSVSLSHYCPTAAALLFDAAPLAIQPLPRHVADLVEGLDARASLPPAVSEAVLIDWHGLSAWDAAVVAVCARDVSTDEVLHTLQALHQHVVHWRPAALPLSQWLAGFLRTPPPAAAAARPIDWSLDALIREAAPATLGAPAPFSDAARVWRAGLHRAWPALAPVLRRYLAARSVACWPLHAGRGLATQIRYLEALVVVLRGEIARRLHDPVGPVPRSVLVAAIRETDRLVLHLADPGVLAARLDAPP